MPQPSSCLPVAPRTLASSCFQESAARLCCDPKHTDLFATAAGDKTVRLWDARSGKCSQLVELSGENISIAYKPDGTAITVGNKEDEVAIYCIAIDPIGSANTLASLWDISEMLSSNIHKYAMARQKSWFQLHKSISCITQRNLLGLPINLDMLKCKLMEQGHGRMHLKPTELGCQVQGLGISILFLA